MVGEEEGRGGGREGVGVGRLRILSSLGDGEGMKWGGGGGV